MKLYFHDLLLQYALQPTSAQHGGGAPTSPHRSGSPSNRSVQVSSDFAPHRVPITIRPSRTAPPINPIVSSAEVFEYHELRQHHGGGERAIADRSRGPSAGNTTMSVAQRRKMWYKTREGNILSFDCDAEALRPFGYVHGDRLLASWGPTTGTWSTVVGVRRGVLWVREDGSLDDGVCALVGFRNKSDFETRMGWVWHGSTTVPETQHVILPTLTHASVAAQFLGTHDGATTTNNSTVLLMRRLRCDPDTMERTFGHYHGEVCYQDREGMSHEGLRLPVTESNPSATTGNWRDHRQQQNGGGDDSRIFFGGGMGSHERIAVANIINGNNGKSPSRYEAAGHSNTNNITSSTSPEKPRSINTSIVIIPAGVDETTGELYAFVVDVNRYLSNLWEHQRATGVEPSLLVSAEDVLHALQQSTNTTTTNNKQHSSLSSSTTTTLPLLASTAFAQRLPNCYNPDDVRRFLGLVSARDLQSANFESSNTVGSGGGGSVLLLQQQDEDIGSRYTKNRFDPSWRAVAKVISLDSHALLNAMAPTNPTTDGVSPLQLPQSDQCVFLVQDIAPPQQHHTSNSVHHQGQHVEASSLSNMVSPSRRHQDIYSLL